MTIWFVRKWTGKNSSELDTSLGYFEDEDTARSVAKKYNTTLVTLYAQRVADAPDETLEPFAEWAKIRGGFYDVVDVNGSVPPKEADEAATESEDVDNDDGNADENDDDAGEEGTDDNDLDRVRVWVNGKQVTVDGLRRLVSESEKLPPTFRAVLTGIYDLASPPSEPRVNATRRDGKSAIEYLLDNTRVDTTKLLTDILREFRL